MLSTRCGHCSTGQPAKFGERKGKRLLLKPLKIQNIVKNIFSTKQDEKLSRQTLLFWLFFWKCSGTNAGGKTTKLSNPTHGLSHRTTSPSPHCRTRAAAVYGRWSCLSLVSRRQLFSPTEAKPAADRRPAPTSYLVSCQLLLVLFHVSCVFTFLHIICDLVSYF